MTEDTNEKSDLGALAKGADEDRVTEILSDDITRLEQVYLSQLDSKFMAYLESNYGDRKITCTKPLISPTRSRVLALYQLLVDGKNIGNLRVVYIRSENARPDSRNVEIYEKMYTGHISLNSDSVILTWRKDKGRTDSYNDIPFG